MASLSLVILMFCSLSPAYGQYDVYLPDLAAKVGATIFANFINVASLGQPLSAPGPMTMFAPNNSAFSKLSPAVMKLLNNNVTELVNVILYHVLNEELRIDNETQNDTLVGTLAGPSIRINVYNVYKHRKFVRKVTTVCGKVVVSADNEADNGVLHVLNGVLFPPPGTIMTAIRKCPELTILTKGLIDIGLTDILEGDGPLTIFAPTDAAFKKLPGDMLEKLLSNRTALEEVLTYHICVGTHFTQGFLAKQYSNLLQMLSLGWVSVNVTETYATANSIKIAYPDINVSNGVVHGMDTVLFPHKLLDDEEI
ncbi:transforming growth factor-beta-induced protein ig-h3-like [Pecten maximus]|uniref:transforming growth factor-beta-induced protein ig-h3-like n=1 Tax=Pecten maximus TaxID=6579 RepID=UPI0014588FDE|nr:transforming growth factor-beta-induced protein ig-h3-like [Pecten maximus]